MPAWLEKPLREVRLWLAARSAAEAIFLLAAMAGVAAVVLSFWKGALPAVLAWAAFLAGAVWAGRRIWASAEGDDAVARRVEEAFPHLDSSLLNAVYFVPRLSGAGQAPAGPNTEPGAELAAWEIERARGLLPAVALRRAIRWDFPRKLLGALLAVALANGIVFFIQPQDYRLAWKSLASPAAGLAALLAGLRRAADPKAARDLLADLSVEVQYPAYTGLPPQKVIGGDGAVSAIKGSLVKISARALESADEAVLEIYGAGGQAAALSLQAQVSGRRVVAAEFTAQAAGKYRFLLDGDPSRDYAIELSEDAYPQIALSEPAAEMEVTPQDQIQVVWNASDDFGLTKVELVAETGSGRTRRVLLSPAEARPAAQGGYLLDLSSTGISEGDEQITLYAEATDNDTVSGPKVARSGNAVLSVRSAGRIHAALLEDQERLLQGMVGWLGDALEFFPLVGAAPKEELLAGFGALDRSSALVAQAFPEILARMQEDELADYNVYVAVQNMGTELMNLRKNLSDWAKTNALSPRKFTGPAGALSGPLSQIASSHEEPLEKDIAYLDRLLYKQQMDDALRSQEDVLAAKERLAQLLEDYKKTKDPELRKKILKEMAQLREKISKALSSLSRLYQEMPDEFTNPKVRDQLESPELSKLDEKLQRALESGDLDSALGDFESFLQQVGDLMSGLQKSSGEFNSENFFKELDGVREAEAEAAKIEQQQKKLLGRTQELQEKTGPQDGERAKSIEQAKGALEEAVRQVAAARRAEQDRLDERQRQLAQAGENSKRREQLQANFELLQRQLLPRLLEGTGQQVEESQASLERLDVESAQAQAMQALLRVEQMQQQVDKNRSQTPAGLLPKDPDSRPALSQARKRLREALEKLEQQKSQGAPSLSPSQSQELSQISDEQGQLQQRAEKLAEKLEKMAEDSPMVDAGPGQGARRAQQGMGEARGRLGQGRPSGAIPGQAAAQAELGKIRQQLGEMRERMEQGAQGGGGFPMPGGLARRGGRGREGGNGNFVDPAAKVEVSAEGQGRVPPELREDILKSMKEPGPAEYEPLNDAYYRKLIR